MGLKQSIVLVNQFTTKTATGGTRGGTPGKYVLRYMARDGATESQLGTSGGQAAYVTDYMARPGAAEPVPGPEGRAVSGLSGMAFSGDDLALSEESLRRRSKAIQDAFDSGKTVMKTVLSFDTEYLVDNNILPEDFLVSKGRRGVRRGDLRGQVDQMRLRHAIQQGLDKVSDDYDDLQYVGVIQVDTKHVHCHLAMVDMGRGTIMDDGTQRGKISASQRARIRRGIDMALDDTRSIQRMASLSFLEQRSVQTALKRYTYEQIAMYGVPQRLMSVLPDDERHWRAGSNSREMRTANRICRDYVETVMRYGDSHARQARAALADYARGRREREGLSRSEEQAIYDKGYGRMVESCMNGVYAQMAMVPKERRHDATSFLSMPPSDEIRPSFRGDAQDMFYRMSAYGSRHSRHRNGAKSMARYRSDYERARDEGRTAKGSEALYRFFLVEEEYHEKAADKYAGFLFFAPPSDGLLAEFEELREENRRCEGLRRLSEDQSARGMKPMDAERYGREVYGAYGGQFATLDPGILTRRYEKLHAGYQAKAAAFDEKLQARGIDVAVDDKDRPYVTRRSRFEFDDVRAVDLHDLRGDFPGALTFDGKARADYLDITRRRVEAFDEASEYLRATGQGHMVEALDPEDIEAARELMERIENREPISRVESVPQWIPRRKQTVRLDADMHSTLVQAIEDEAVRSVAEIDAGQEL